MPTLLLTFCSRLYILNIVNLKQTMKKDHAWVKDVNSLTHLTELMQASLYERKYYRRNNMHLDARKVCDEIEALKQRRKQIKEQNQNAESA